LIAVGSMDGPKLEPQEVIVQRFLVPRGAWANRIAGAYRIAAMPGNQPESCRP